MKDFIQPTCATCHAYFDGDCRFNSPKVHKAGDNGYFPKMDPQGYCMKHTSLKGDGMELISMLGQISDGLAGIETAIKGGDKP